MRGVSKIKSSIYHRCIYREFNPFAMFFVKFLLSILVEAVGHLNFSLISVEGVESTMLYDTDSA